MTLAKRRRRPLQLESLEIRRVLAQSVNFLGDLDTDPVPSIGLDPSAITNVNGVAYFSGRIGDTGFGLWKSDGTGSGTQLLEESIQPKNITHVGSSVFFVGTHGGQVQLWKSDGTAAGTALASTVTPKVGTLTNVNGTLFFSGNELGGQSGLFKFNEGTSAAELILPSGPNTVPLGLVNVNGTLFFNALKPGSTTQRGLWKSDGTADGTVRIDDSQANFNPLGLTNYNGTLVFSAVEIEGRELWKSDGTTEGTVLIKNIDPGNPTPQNPGDPSSNPERFTVIGDKLFFTASRGSTGRELYRSDGTEAGTFRLKDIAPTGSSLPADLTNVSGQLFFTAISDVGRELWVSNGTSAGTQLVEDISAGEASTVFNGLVNLNGKLLFAARNGAYGDELWSSDGTEAGTTVVKDIVEGPEGSLPRSLANVGGKLFFSASDNTHGRELWSSDGTEAGTKIVRNVVGNESSNPEDFTSIGTTTFFTANFDNPPEGEIPSGELWKSDGTAAGTVKLVDIVRGIVGIRGYPYIVRNDLTNVNGMLFFANGDALHGFELWKSDGTPEGTAMVKDIRFGNFGSIPEELTNVDGTLFFRARGENGQAELWKSDGSEEGTVQVVDLTNDGSYHLPGSHPHRLANVGGTLYFNTDDGTQWKSDGTAAGTVETEVPSTAVAVDDDVYYLDFNNDRSLTLRKTDEQGVTKGLKTFRVASNLTNVAGTLYFAAQETWDGTVSLWKTNGTSLGTVRVGPLNANVADLINVGGQLFFTAVDDATGRELWKSDGTSAGTVRVRDIMPGQLTSSPANLRNVAGVLYFTASNGVTGDELWRSNGTFSGTFAVRDIFAGAGGAQPEDLAATDNGMLFLSAHTPAFGREPYALIAAANFAPAIGLGGTIGYVHDEPPITLAPFATVEDVDSPNFDGGRLHIRITDGTSSSNRLAIGVGFTIDAQNNVRQGETIIGRRISNGFATNPLTIVFNANATPAIVQQLVRAITFKTVGGSAGQRKVLFLVSDGDGGVSEEVAKLVNVS